MGTSIIKRLILLCVMLAAFSAIIYSWTFTSEPTALNVADLSEYLSIVPNWQRQTTIPLDPNVASVLELDDYLNAEYINKTGSVSLYIGQYYSAKKIGAVHHPLVCLPGQGLKVTQRSSGKIIIKNKSSSYNIAYTSIVTEINNQKNFIIYWFQVGDSAYSNTFPQKVASFWNTLTGQEQKNAYVRITTPLYEKNMNDAKSLIFKFIDDFYPVYLDYLSQKDSDKV